MKIFKDKELTQEIENNTFILGEVLAGETETYTLWVSNDSFASLKYLDFSIEHEEVKILEYPKEIRPNFAEKFIFEWSPSVTLKQGLKVKLKVIGKELWGG